MVSTEDYNYLVSLKEDRGDLKLRVAELMRQYGGSFVKALSECVIRADSVNYLKLINAFEGYFLEYNPAKWVKI